MNMLPQVYLVRHGETEWALSGKHTGLSDIPLTERGEQNALRLGQRLGLMSFGHVLTSPLQRAARTCELAGFGSVATKDVDLVEWNYGRYEGKKTAEIHQDRPDWEIFRDGCPDGESVSEIGTRADRVVARLRTLDGNSLLFSSAHFLRVLASRWLVQDVSFGRSIVLDTASVSILGYDHSKSEPVIRLWNDCRHIARE